MCGIAGVLRRTGEGEDGDAEIVSRMLRRLERRGPDGEGLDRAGPLTLGHRRLAILDLSEAGHQPMWTESRRWVLSFNGEIYNFDDLKRELGVRDDQLRSRTDTEILLLAWERWGPATLERLVGQFAFAIYDRQDRRLWLARDRFGEKPLFYHEGGGALAFASTLRALIEAPWVPRELDESALAEYLTLRYVVSPRTVLAGCRKLPPGHLLVAGPEGVSTRAWFEPRFHAAPSRRAKDPRELVEEFGALLVQASKRCLVSDVPVALLLSDGIDSHAIRAALIDGGSPVPSFTYRMESGAATGIVPSEGGDPLRRDVVVSPDERLDALRAALSGLNEPVGDGASLATWMLIRAARPEATVFLCGHGGDELLGGYRLSQDRFRLAGLRRLAWLPSWSLRLLVDSKVFGAESAAERQRRVRRARPEEIPAASRYLIHRPLDAGDVASLLPAGPLPEPYLGTIDRLYADCSREARDLDRIQEVMIRTFLAENILTFADSVAMDHSAELRMPFLDRDLANFVLSLPTGGRVSPWPGRTNTKRMLRWWGRGRIPDDVLHRRKHGFNYGSLRELLGHDGDKLRAQVLDATAVRRALPGVESWLDQPVERIRGAREKALWSVLALAAWCETAGVR